MFPQYALGEIQRDDGVPADDLSDCRYHPQA